MGKRNIRKSLTMAVGIGLGGAASYVLLTRLNKTGPAIEVHKTLDIAARVERVFDFWTSYENFPDWMSHVRAVHDLDGVRSRWTVTGPLGLPVEWNAVLTEVIPNKMLAWKTLPTSNLQHTGKVQFSKNPDGSAHLDISLRYWPPLGSFGHAMAELAGIDPRSQMDDDLTRMKSLMETGAPDTEESGLIDENDSTL